MKGVQIVQHCLPSFCNLTRSIFYENITEGDISLNISNIVLLSFLLNPFASPVVP